MCFPIASCLAVLATISNVSAWHLTAYTNVLDCNPNDETGYQILEGNQGNCYTFGWSMPGVSCAHYTGGGIDNQGCKGLFEAIAMYAHENTNCEFFARDDCRGVGAVRDAETCVNNLEMLETSGTERIRSFKCANTE
ncbi:hypothetical protein NW752_008141 [Fusarium irregulare]|uniref:Secreted LysM effector LysM C-terminal domain-containing protein n=1 Tax=Fusarium irregulare TaxID=2494466 RepID=A0A9W8PX97_9HYPO|nr:hypothetical protein NW752_008141 [Fusarium irregulare]KAJ4019602.1 hypothetical protein NW766_003340 [Fusarium irregulare]